MPQIDLRGQGQGILPYAETVAGEGGGGQAVANVFSALLGAIMLVAAVLVLLYLIWGAFEWITSGGDSGKTEKARSKITAAIIGIILMSSTIAIFMLIQNLLGVNLVRFSGINGGGVGGGASGYCSCWNGGYTPTGTVAIGSGGSCYICVDGRWNPHGGPCSVITCGPLPD